MKLVRPTLRLRVAALYGALVLVIAASLLFTAYSLLNRALSTQLVCTGCTIKVTSPDGKTEPFTEGQLVSAIREPALNYLLGNGILYFGVIAIIGAIGGYMLARASMRPVARITSTARRLSTKTLSERISLGGPDDEIRELADTFDEMLARLDAAFSSQRRFVANASHELRTPLAVIQTELDVSLSDDAADAEELRRMGEVVRDATNRAQRLVDALLALARLQGREGQGLETTELVNLNTLIPNAVAAAEADAATRDVSISIDGDPIRTYGDPRLLERVIGNLVENAVRYNVPGGWVRVHTESVSEGPYRMVRLSVSNTGPVVAPDDVEGLFDAFRRGGKARTNQKGAGLGLSIVRAIVDAHRGYITATAQSGGGLKIEITLASAANTAAMALA